MSINNWHSKVVRYSKGITTEPGGFHDGPDFIEIDRTGFYVWEFYGGLPKNLGLWVLNGPFKNEATAKNYALGI